MSQDSTPIDFTPPAVEEIADLLPAYEILSFIAKGGMGAVYLARQKSLDRQVAIKILPRHFGEDADFRSSFEAEAKSMAKFNHPNLIGIYDFGQVDGLLYIIMEMVQGKSLYHSAYGRTIDPDESARIVAGICRGLSSAHNHGILHRDIKPANILLDPNASPKIGDFGLARPVGDHESDSAFGTPGYTAPEVVHNPSAVDESTDLYSVGVILYELLTGKLPESIYTPAATLIGCDPRFDQIVRKATHPTPAMRYRKAEDIAEALEDIRKNKKPANPLLMKAQGSTAPPRQARSLVTPGSDASRPKLNTGTTNNTDGDSASKNPPASSSQSPATAVNAGSNVPFIRNIIIIIGLLAAIFIAWEGLKVVRANRDAEQARVKALDAEQKKEAEQKRKDAAAAKLKDPKNNVVKRPVPKNPQPTPPKVETPREMLARLRPQLLRGDRTELPKGAFTRDGRARMYIEDEMTWPEARAFCERHGGHLAILPEANDLQWLSSKLKYNQTIWLGAGSAGDNQWRWIDGTPWKQEIRKTSKSSYVAVDDTGILTPKPASTLHSFFIEWSMDGQMPASLDNQLKRCADSIESGNPQYPAGTTSYDNRHFLLIQMNSDWETARNLAETGKGHLAVPSNADENIWILGFVASSLEKDQACWIGGFRPSNEDWKWSTGEPWKFAKWGTGAPNEDSGTIAGCAVQPSQSWDDYSIDTSLSHFLIEWSSDNKGLKSVDTGSKGAKPSAGPVDQLSSLRRKCASLILKIQQKYEKDFSSNIRGYEQELTVFRRGLTKSLSEAYTPGILTMTSNYPGNRIPENLPRENMPEKVAEILDIRLERQNRIQSNYISEIEDLREKYRANLHSSVKDLESNGLKSASRLIKQEIEDTAGNSKSFVDHILKAG
ncbi:hypothetical protein NT6N_12280 [Oceaniferula spumae]|uniref:Non-specific serine/threonine protein kinase n=1 Tax=Oceaniferula spumae TaxID=2979115 RepID=A0AAT9FJJ6_9BACT